MTNTEKIVTWGLMALIAYELYRPSGTMAGCAAPGPLSSDLTAPRWIQQLAQCEYGKDFYTPQCGVFGRCG